MLSNFSRLGRALFATAAVTAVFASACDRSASEDLGGRWLHEENGESAELLLEHDKSTGKVNGTFVALGKRAAISGRADASALVIDKVGDVVASAENGAMVGAISGEQMLLTITQPGQEIVILRMTRQVGSGPTAGAVASKDASNERSASPNQATAVDDGPFTPSRPEEFVGSWEAVSDDGTNSETAKLELADGAVTGIIRSLERGYYSGRVTVNSEVSLRGTPRDGRLDVRAWNAQSGNPENAVAGRAVRRGDFLILQIGDGETGYARPGIPVVRSAEGSPEAASLAQAIAGRVYSASTQSSGRGAFVGNRVRLALCSDGNIAFDVSDLASTGGAQGVDIGDATSRRGQWGVVLRAGTPVVRAQWTGTGSSYSLTRYFRVQPHKDGSGARVDGTDLPAAGSC
jgi:hypothetical protein